MLNCFQGSHQAMWATNHNSVVSVVEILEDFCNSNKHSFSQDEGQHGGVLLFGSSLQTHALHVANNLARVPPRSQSGKLMM